MSKYLFFSFLLLLMSLSLFAQDMEPDSSAVEIRTFNEERLAEFRADEDFAYDRPAKKVDDSWFERFMEWIRSTWTELFSEDTPLWVTIVVFGGLLLGLVGLFLYIFGVDVRNLFGRSEKKIQINVEEMPSDIHALDFDQLVRTATQTGDYRRAVRLLYLESLKMLSEKGWIDWQINKTNYDYHLELIQTPVAIPFDDLTLHYEYVWYGDFPVDEGRFLRIEQIFRDFQQKLKHKA